MVWIWFGIGAAIGIAAFFLFIYVMNTLDGIHRARARRIRQLQAEADLKQVTLVQNVIAEMFETVRRSR